MTFNSFDYLVILFLLLGTIWGLLRGVGKLLVGLLSLYVGLVLSLLLYRPLANWLRDVLHGMSISGSETLAFVFMLILCVGLFNVLTRFFVTPPEERKRKKKGEVQEEVEKQGVRFIIGPLNQVAGMVVGFAVTVVWLSLLLAALQFSLRAGGGALGSAGVNLRQQMLNSVMVYMSNYVLFYIYKSVSWMPGDVPSIFADIVGQFV
jgi:uncharacterized membrane protein required for colicin V production